MSLRVRVIGAGFAGATAARILAEAGASVEVWDRRLHLGGNAYDRIDENGIRIHPYGPHIFHTNSTKVFDWLSRFTAWHPYTHRVKAHVDGKLITLPITIDSLESLFETQIDDASAEQFVDRLRITHDRIENAEQYLLANVGSEICDKIFRPYSEKQWGRKLSDIPVATVARIPLRFDRNEAYFTDKYECLPSSGYANLFENILDHPSIRISLGCEYSGDAQGACDHLIYTGPLDRFFDFRHGKLPYRSLRFEFEQYEFESYQSHAVENFPDASVPYTRITEFKKLTGQISGRTTIVKEYPCEEGDPFYPVIDATSRDMVTMYKRLASTLPDVTFIGRLAEFRYYNMDQVVASAMATTQRLITRLRAEGRIR
jgi:UDP-galactopyranose mutase